MSDKRTTRAVAVLMLSALAATLTPTWSAPAATLIGQVLGEDARRPVRGAVVRIETVQGAALRSAPTGEDGAFRIANIAPGDYRVSVETEAGAYRVVPLVTFRPDQVRSLQMALRLGEADGEGEPPLTSGGGRSGMSAGKKAFIGLAVLFGVGYTAGELFDSGVQSASPSSPGG